LREGREVADFRHQPPQGVITGPKGRTGRRRLARGAHSGQFAHDQAEVEREDAAEIAFIVIDPAAQGGAPEAPAVQDVGESPLNLFAALFEQGFLSRALPLLVFHRVGGPGHRHPGFWLKIGGLAPLGVGVADDGAQAGRLPNDGQLPGTVEAFVAGEILHMGGPFHVLPAMDFLHQFHGVHDAA